MSEAEDKFKAVVRQALVDASAIGDPDQLDDYADSVVGSLKLDEWFIYLGEVREVLWDNVVDWQDTGVVYSIKVSYTDEELEEDDA